ncbi:DUF4199 domain-containing protein [Compostibacter hankyongensis]|uniref:DUF4199 domain-containing protein n=1 Tax=Compostibacter hankyongensis TaxID=1007089 RepID=A0ABP8FPW4_9BACT
MANRPSSNTGMIFGAIAALVSVLSNYLLYRAGVYYFMSTYQWIGFAVIVLLAVAATLLKRRRQGGYLEFRDALRSAFVVLVIVAVVNVLFQYLLFKVIDPAFDQQVQQERASQYIQMMKRSGASAEKIQEQTATLKEKSKVSIGGSLVGLGTTLIIYFFISLIIAFAVKRKAPDDRRMTPDSPDESLTANPN